MGVVDAGDEPSGGAVVLNILGDPASSPSETGSQDIALGVCRNAGASPGILGRREGGE